MSAETATVFVVDDDDAVRKSLVRLLRAAHYCVVAAASATEFLDQASAATHPCCAVLDVRLPDLDGMELPVRLERAGRSMPIVFITGHGDIPMGVKAMKQGAVDFLPKPFEPRELTVAVRAALERDRGETRDRGELGVLCDRVGSLTPRECQVFARVAVGMLNKQIAADLGITTQTVKFHRGRLMRKLKIESTAALVQLADALRAHGVMPKG